MSDRMTIVLSIVTSIFIAVIVSVVVVGLPWYYVIPFVEWLLQ